MISINYMKTKSLKILTENNDLLTMAISNCLSSLILKIPSKFSVWCVFAKFNTKSNQIITGGWLLTIIEKLVKIPANFDTGGIPIFIEK